MEQDAASSSRIESGEVFLDSIHSEKSKKLLKEALTHCEKLLLKNDLILESPSTTISEQAALMGEEIFNHTVEMITEKVMVEDEELILPYEEDSDQLYKPEEEDDTSDSDEYDFTKEKRIKFEYIPLETKIKVLQLARAHPTWSLETLQRKGSRSLKRKDDLKRWEKDVENGGTVYDKYAAINQWTYDRFVEARAELMQVTTRNLREWALVAARQFRDSNFEFKASMSWAKKSKKMQNIRQGKITKYISRKEYSTMTSVLEASERFCLQVKAIIKNFEPQFIINTDQMGCHYQFSYDRTLAEKGSKSVLIQKKDLNKLSHSYTVNYGITVSGELLPNVYLCLQEPTGSFGPRVKRTVDDLASEFGNVVVTCSKSGKLTTALYREFLQKVIKPYVKDNIFLLIVDSWGGQTNPVIYDEIFHNEELSTCTVKIIPPKCTTICQPCDVYFHRQIKNFTKKLQNCSYLVEQNREISSREDSIRIHSLIHHQLSAPIFQKMIKYAWFASKLSDQRDLFKNVNEVCFPFEKLKKPCACSNVAFSCCSRCQSNLCFVCFYDNYHPKNCTIELENE